MLLQLVNFQFQNATQYFDKSERSESSRSAAVASVASAAKKNKNCAMLDRRSAPCSIKKINYVMFFSISSYYNITST